jgi:hypothetical protein
MGAVLHFTNHSGKKEERVWKVSEGIKFTALIKCFVQNPGDKTFQTIERPSTRPATFSECYQFAKKLKIEYGDTLKQLIVWNVDEMKSSNYWG